MSHYSNRFLGVSSALRNVSIKSKYGRPSMQFNLDGTLKYVELDILNLNNALMWEKVPFVSK